MQPNGYLILFKFFVRKTILFRQSKHHKNFMIKEKLGWLVKKPEQMLRLFLIKLYNISISLSFINNNIGIIN
jgi:hypothetical protein